MDTLNSEDFLQYVSSYEPTGRVIEHPTLGDFTQLENPQGHKILRKIIPADTLSKVDVAIFEQYRTLTYNRIVKFLGITENLEGGHEGYAAYYENFGETLKDEIERKAVEGTKYAELEILKILQNVASSLSYMMSTKVYHGEIKSINVVKVGQDYKVLNPVLFGKFTQLVKDDRPRLPKFHTKIVTPEVRHAIYREILDPVHETYKDDVFGIGMIALDLMTLKVDPTIPIEKRLEKSNFLFSNDLVRFVKKALERIVSLRLDPVACCSYLERIQLQHGLVSVQRFSKRGRNYSVLPRESNMSESMLSEASAPEENLPALKKMPSRENNYNRRTESVIPSRISENPEPVELRMNETVRQSVANYENPVYAKKIGDIGGDRESIRHSTASTAFSTEQRVTRWEVFRESNRWSVFDTPRTSNIDDITASKIEGQEVRPSINVPCVTSTREFVGVGEYRFEEGRPSEGNSSPSLSSILNIPVSFTSPPRSTGPFESSQNGLGGLDNSINVKFVQSEMPTPQSTSNEVWRSEVNTDRSAYSRAETGTSNLKESNYIVDPNLQPVQESKEISYVNTNQEKTEHTTKSIYMPEETKAASQPQKNLVLSIPTDQAGITNKASPRFVEPTKEAFKMDFQNVRENHAITAQQAIYFESDRLQTNSFLVSMNDILPHETIQRSTQETNDDVEYIEDEPSIDQTFSDPVAEIQELVKPEQMDLMSRYSVPNTYSSASLTTDYSMTRGEMQSERKSMTPQTYSNSSLPQQDYKYFSSYEPRQSYDGFSSQSKMGKKTVETLSDGSVYEGEVIGYMKQGKGKLTYPDGKYFEGDWKVGQINGQGKLYASNGSVIYDGQWQDAKYHGRGTLYNLNPVQSGWVDPTQGLKISSKEEGAWMKYNGSLRNSQWDGYGELFLSNGDKYVGEFKKDAANGKGKYLSAGGQEWEGQWVNNCLIQN